MRLLLEVIVFSALMVRLMFSRRGSRFSFFGRDIVVDK